MVSKTEKYRQIIRKTILKYFPFRKNCSQVYVPTARQKSEIILPSAYPFRSSHQINKNILTIYPIYQTTNYTIQTMSVLQQHNYPQSCIGLILGQHNQNGNTYNVYGTGTLIYKNIVITSAQNVYCRRLHKNYVDIKFITNVNGNKCNGIYTVRRVHYPKEYTGQEEYEQYDFAVLQLYDDLSEGCGSVGWKQDYNQGDYVMISYGYMMDSKQGYLNLRQITSCKKLEENYSGCSGTGLLLKEENQYYIVGIMSSVEKYKILRQEMRNMIDKINITLDNSNFMDACDQIVKHTTNELTSLILSKNKIDAQGCKYLNKANWMHLTQVHISRNSIGDQGCKYLAQASWIIHLTEINLFCNNIGDKGCNYLNQANCIHLKDINLSQNQIGDQGYKYLSQTNWKHLTKINLFYNNFGQYVCKYLSHTNWSHLTSINLGYNNIDNAIDKIILKQLWPKIQI